MKFVFLKDYSGLIGLLVLFNVGQALEQGSPYVAP